MKVQRIIIWAAFISSGLDLLSKKLVLQFLGDEPVKILGSFLKLQLTYNSGAAFSFAPSATYFFSFFSIAIALATIHYSKRLVSRGWAVVAGLVLGGILGNMIDRIFRAPSVFRGEVVDWIQIPHWPTFNIADSSIFMAALIACILTFRNIQPFQVHPRDTNKAGDGNE